MTDNPLAGVLNRLYLMAQRDGTVYCRIVWNPDQDTFLFTPLLKKFVTVSYEEKQHD